MFILTVIPYTQRKTLTTIRGYDYYTYE